MRKRVGFMCSIGVTSMTAFLGHFDFIYSLPNAWLSVPFTFLGRSRPQDRFDELTPNCTQGSSRKEVQVSHSVGEVSGNLSRNGPTLNSVVGSAKAKEVLIFGKKMDAQDLLECGFVK